MDAVFAESSVLVGNKVFGGIVAATGGALSLRFGSIFFPELSDFLECGDVLVGIDSEFQFYSLFIQVIQIFIGEVVEDFP